jgi:hypothetical protein
MGNLKSYVKSLDMLKKWEQNKNDPTKAKPSLFGAQNAAAPPRGNDMQLSLIMQRLDCGKELSSDELEYLRKHRPEIYEKAVQVKREREQYERDLRRCKTKDEVNALRMGKTSTLHGDARSAGTTAGGSGVSDVRMRAMAISDEHSSFVGSRHYRELPGDRREVREQKKNGTYRPPVARVGGELLFYDKRARKYAPGTFEPAAVLAAADTGEAKQAEGKSEPAVSKRGDGKAEKPDRND